MVRTKAPAPGPRAPDPDPPVGMAEFEALMRPFEPFERKPRLAVAVSGGRDSLALALLVREWIRPRGGEAIALIVDHGLRPESAEEAELARQWLGAVGIEAHVFRLRWARKPTAAVQAEARARRYRVMIDWCAEQGVLHLLTAHQADDQAETRVLRMARDSGPEGLAGMSACIEHPEARVLRPLLPVARARLAATLKARRQPWLDDPSNEDPRFARGKLRRLGLPLPRESVLAAVDDAARKRVDMERKVAAGMAEVAEPHPLGGVFLDFDGLRALPRPIAFRVLSRVLATVAGAEYEPRRERLMRALDRVRSGIPTPRRTGEPASPKSGPSGTAVGGCQILWRGGRWLVVREPASVMERAAWRGDAALDWDGRFTIGEALAGGVWPTTDWRGQQGLPGRGWQTEAIMRLYPVPLSTQLKAAASMPPPPQGHPLIAMPAADVSRWRLAFEAEWPATPGLSVLLAGTPAMRWESVVVPLTLRSAAELLVQPLRPPASGVAPVVMPRFAPIATWRPLRPLFSAPFFPCFAGGEGQLVES